ncbi:MAG: Maf family protein, partial [Neisseria sp.]|nr:Maf family protein [Neisseria sp.]
MKTALPLILASTSPFRREQLGRLKNDFTAAAPDFDETPEAGESARETALRLAVGKAKSLAAQFPEALIIGADQVAFCNGKQLGKPMSVARAQQMLAELSGQTITFYSAVCLLNTFSDGLHSHVDETVVKMR